MTDTLEAGPELDARVAEALGGYRRRIDGWWVLPDVGAIEDPPPFSTSIAHAWRLVDEWVGQSIDHHYSVGTVNTQDGGHEHVAHFDVQGDDLFEGRAPSPALAIVRAWLRAKEGA